MHLRTRMIRINMLNMSSPLTPQSAPHRTVSSPPKQVRSSDLLAGQRRLLIEHKGQVYTLSRPRQDKLILTK